MLKQIIALTVLFIASEAVGAEGTHITATPPAKPDDNGAAEQVDVDAIKQKYWARGEESELGVVQNRLYSKKEKLELGVFGGIISTDPFLTVKSAGGLIGYHLTEYWAVNVIGWKHFVEPSTALTTFEQTIGATTNNNRPTWYFGAEGMASILYGKLSVVGKSIIYYDFHLIGGLGVTGTESGKYFTPSVGLGQQVYLSKSISLRVDYRLMNYTEQIIEKVITPKLGQVVGERSNWSNSVTVGFDILWEVK